jgi:protein tyrosine/serine phosphatase
MLKLSYQPSQRHALNKGLVIILNVNLLDVSTQLIQLECAAGLSTHCEWMKAPPVMMDFFEGVFDEKIIRERVHEILHLILDKAQETCESPECCKELLDKTSGTVWITPGLRENK